MYSANKFHFMIWNRQHACSMHVLASACSMHVPPSMVACVGVPVIALSFSDSNNYGRCMCAYNGWLVGWSAAHRGQLVCLNCLLFVNTVLNGLENDLKFQGTLAVTATWFDLYSNTIN